MITPPQTWRWLLKAAFVAAFVVAVVESCGGQRSSEPTVSTAEALSSPGVGDQILRTGGQFWEQTSVVVPAGADSHCPNGRVFFSGDGHVYYADLACVRSGTCTRNTTTDITGSIPVNAPGATPDFVNGPSTDNQFLRMKDGSIVWVRNGVRMKRGQAFASILTWRSSDCGGHWTYQGAFEGDTALDGRCGWPWQDSHLAYYRPGASPSIPGSFVFDEDGDNTGSLFDESYAFGRSSNPANNVPATANSNFKPVLGMWNLNDFVQGWNFFSAPFFIPELRAKVGLFDNGAWYLDKNGDHVWDPSTDITGSFGVAGDVPIVGKWNVQQGDNRDLIGVYRDASAVGVASMFYLDLNGNYVFDGCSIDGCYQFGTKGDRPVPLRIGHSSAKGRAQTIGDYRPSNGTWYGDTNGNHAFDGCTGGDTCLTTFNQGTGAFPVIGYWDGPQGTSQIGTFQNGTWKLDANGDGVWNPSSGDLTYTFGAAGDIPLVEFPNAFDQGYPGTFDRPEAYADPNNAGWLYVTANCSYNETREMVIGWSNDYGVTWNGTQIFNPPGAFVPQTMASVRGDSLYLFGNVGASPVIVPVRVNVGAALANAVTPQSPWYPFAVSGTFSSPPDTSTFMDRVYSLPDFSLEGSLGVAPVDRVLTTDRLLAVYPVHKSGVTNYEAAKVMEVKVTWNGSSVSDVRASQVANISSTDATGNTTLTTMVEGPRGTRTALTYWKSTAAASGNQTEYMAWRGFAAGSLPFDFGPQVQTSGNLSTTSTGSKRTWPVVGPYIKTGDYVKGAGYAGPAGPEFFTHWTETPTTTADRTNAGALWPDFELHTKKIGVTPNGPTWGADNLGGGLVGGPAVTSWAVNRLDVMARGQDNQLWHLYYSTSGWHAWEPWGGTLSSSPAVTAWSPERLDIVARLSDGRLWHAYYDSSLNPVYPGFVDDLGAVATGTPAITNWGFGRLDVFARGTNGQLLHTHCQYGEFCFPPIWDTRGTPSGVTLVGGVGATAWASGRIDTFIRGSDGNVWQMWYDSSLPNGWQAWNSIGAPSAGIGNAEPAVTSWGPNQLDVYVVGNADGAIYRRRYNNGWYAWENLGTNRGAAFQTGVAAESWAPGRTDLFAIGTVQELLHAYVQE